MTEDWTELVIGIILITSPWILGFSDISLAKWCNIVLGLVLVIINAWMIFGNAAQEVPLAEEPHKGKQR
jgi:hypothetical protein